MMALTLEELQNIKKRLSNDRVLAKNIKSAAKDILEDAAYKEWFKHPRFEGEIFKGKLPAIFSELGISKLDKLDVQIHAMREGVFLTDTPRTDITICVYPFQRESACAYECADKYGLYQWGNIWFDLAGGCGNHLLSLSRKTLPFKRYVFDINDRALEYARINAILNEVDDLAVISKNDIQNGIPIGQWDRDKGNAVFIVNMPFNISAMPGTFPSYGDGGQTGIKLTLAALKAIKDYWQKTGNPVKGLILSYAVGKSASGPWEITNYVEQIFGKGQADFSLLTNEKMIRVTGVKQCSVPAELKELIRLADCRIRFSDNEREGIRQAYKKLVDQLSADGWTHVGYGTLFIDLPGK